MADLYTAPENLDSDISRPTQTDLSAKTYFAVKHDSNELVVLAGAGEQAIGILQNAPLGTATEEALAQVRTLGLSRAKAAGTITSGAFLKSDADGKLVVTTTDRDLSIGMALTSADSGDEFLMLVIPGNVSHA